MAPLIELAVRGTALLLLALAGAALLHRRSASIRASLWTAAFTALLVLPAIVALVPAWHIPVLTPTSALPALESRAPFALDVTSVSTANAPSLPASATTTAIEGSAVEPVVTQPITWAAVTLVGLGLITAVLLLRIVLAYRRMRGIASRAEDADPLWHALVDDLRPSLGISRRVDVRVTDATNVPAVIGISQPVLLLPVDTDPWSVNLRRAVVLHELAHVARRDQLGQLLGQIACAIYWFIPLAWYGARRAAAFRERASDDAVIEAGVRPSVYAESLIALARSSSRALQSEASMAMAESRIHERISAILSTGARRNRLSWRWAAVISATTLFATAGVAAIEPVGRSQAPVAAQAPVAIAAPSVPAAVAPAPAAQATAAAAPAPRPLPAQAAVSAQSASSTSRLCDGKGLDNSSSSVQENDRERKITIKLSGSGCTVEVRAEGRFDFNADFTDIGRMDANGFFRADVTERGVRRQLDIESKGGTITHTWRVDGREAPYDNAARAWFAAFLIELDRRTAMGIDVRLPLLLKQGGVDAVLKETALMASDYARTQYHLKLPTMTKVTPAEATRILQQAAGVTKSDYYKAELVAAYVLHVQDPSVRAALIDLVERTDSDYYQAESLQKILGSRAPGPAEMDVLMRILPRMESDHYKTEVLKKVLQAPSISANHRAAIAAAAGSISSDYNAAEVLKVLAKGGLSDDAVRKAFFDAAAKVSSDHYHGEVLKAILDVPSATERDLLEVVAQSTSVSGYYRADLLEQVARHRAATDRVKTAAIDASANLSKHYADQVRRAAGR